MHKLGFTLIELLVVVMIVSVLTAVAVPQYRRAIDRSKAAEAMQVLPALFEARERWVIEHQCEWSNAGTITSCVSGSGSFSPGKLDIETKGTISGNKITTKNFEYNLVDSKPTNRNQACVSAKPLWGKDRGLKDGATIWYRGDKFSCNGSNAGCDILNVVTKKNESGEMVYEGCI